MVAHTNAYFLFGGTSDAGFGQIARFDYVKFEWDKAGELVSKKRKRFNAIFDGSSFVIVGGAKDGALDTSNDSLENCPFRDDKNLACQKMSSDVDWSRYLLPVLFMIGLNDGNVCFFVTVV